MISGILPSNSFILLTMIPSLTKAVFPPPFFFDLYGKAEIDIHRYETGHREKKYQL